MSVIYIVLPLALLFAAGAIYAFLWAARAGQFDDVETPSVRILLDESGENPPQRSGVDATGQPAQDHKH